MKKLILISLAFILISCGPSPEEMATVAIVTCNIMAETKNMDGALRIKEINAAREKLGKPAFLGSDDVIKESFEYGLCTSLVLNNDNDYRDLLTSAILKGVKEAEAKYEEGLKLEPIRRSLFNSLGCISCHSIDGSDGIGMTVYKTYGTERRLSNGEIVIIDREYIRESIVESFSKIADGYSPIMPSYNSLSDEKLNILIDYIVWLNTDAKLVEEK